jgi:hypothetical protein
LTAPATAFDEQLAVLERILGPLTDWSAKWAQAEDRLMNLRLARDSSRTPRSASPPTKNGHA